MRLEILEAVTLSAAARATAGALAASPQASGDADDSHIVRYRNVDVDGIRIFYREAGNPRKPTILLLHGFPSSSFMYRDLMVRLSDRFHLVAA